MSYAEDRWSDSAPECPTCGRRIRSLTTRPCAECERGETFVEPEVQTEHPESSVYPSLSMTPEQLADWRKKCQAFDASQGKPVPEPVIEEAEEMAYHKR